MGRVSSGQAIPPFLSKLVQLTQTVDPLVARWNPTGTVFEIVNEQKFSDVLKSYFKGNAQTFVRQLHFYNFRKVDSELRIGAAWGFEHEDHYFVRDNVELIKEIRRKTKVDPDSQKLASFDEVQALKNQVNFLADTLDTLRSKLSNVNDFVENAARPSNESYKVITPENPLQKSFDTESEINFNNKRPRSSFIQTSTTQVEPNFSAETLTEKDTFDQLVSNITPPYSPNIIKTSKSSKNVLARNNSLMSLTSNKSYQSLDEFSEMFSDLELSDCDFENFSMKQNVTLKGVKDIKTEKLTSFDNKENVHNVYVKKISEATKVKESDVSKILNYLSNLSSLNNLNLVSEETIKTKTVEKQSVRKLDYIRYNELNKLVPEIRVQKVGAN